MIRLFSVCTPSRLSQLVVLNYFGLYISQVCSFEVSLWIVCAIFSSSSRSDFFWHLYRKIWVTSESPMNKSERLLMVLSRSFFPFVPSSPMWFLFWLFSSFFLSVLVNLHPLSYLHLFLPILLVSVSSLFLSHSVLFCFPIFLPPPHLLSLSFQLQWTC